MKKSITERNRLERLANAWPITFKELYKKYWKKLTTILRAAKIKYYKDQLKESQGDPKRQRKSINILGRTSNKISHYIKLKANHTDITESFNEFLLITCGPLDQGTNENKR